MQYLAHDPFPAVISYLSSSNQSSQQLRSKAIYALSGLLKHNAAAIAPFGSAGGWEALRGALSGIANPSSHLSVHPFNPPILTPVGSFVRCDTPIHSTYRPDSDIGVRRKAAFLLNNLLTPAVAVAAATTTNPSSSPDVGVHGGESQSPASVHPNSHASMVADPASADTAPETLRALRTHGLLPVLVQELTEPTPYGPDGDEGDGCDADLVEKLTRSRIKTPTFDPFQIEISVLLMMSSDVFFCRLLYTYVSAHAGTFDGPEKVSLRTFLESREVSGGQGEITGLSADELQALKIALT